MKRLLFLLLAFLLLIPSLLLAAEQDPRTLTYPPLTFTIPASERFVLNNGMVVHLLQDHELPMLSITAYVNTGSIYEPADKVGLAGLTGAVMRSGGVKGITPSELDRQLEQMASSIEATIGSDVGNVSLSCLSRNLQPTLELFAQVMRNPAFAADRVELARKSSIEAVRRQNDDPQEVADRELMRAIYAGHPLGRVPTVASLTNISRQDMIAFHRRYFAPSNVILAVAGDVSWQDLEAQLNKVFGSWQGGTILPKVTPLPTEPGARVLFANKEVSQSAIRMGHRGIDKSNPDLYAVRVLEYILGGGFTSRLMTEVRSNQGLAYNVSANFDIGRRFIGTFTAETETKSTSTVKAITLMRDIIATMTHEQVTDQELSLAKESIVNSFIFGFARPDAIINQRARLEYYGYPAGYLEGYRDRIAQVTREDVLRVAQKYLHPEALTLVVVGDGKQFDKPLSTLGSVEALKLEQQEERQPQGKRGGVSKKR